MCPDRRVHSPSNGPTISGYHKRLGDRGGCGGRADGSPYGCRQEDVGLSRSTPLLFLAPQLYGAPGGVQAYMRRLREILTAYGQARALPVHCLSLVDALEERAQHSQDILPGTFQGCAGKKLAFVFKTLSQVIKRRRSVVIVGHLGQAPIAWVMRKLG